MPGEILIRSAMGSSGSGTSQVYFRLRFVGLRLVPRFLVVFFVAAFFVAALVPADLLLVVELDFLSRLPPLSGFVSSLATMEI